MTASTDFTMVFKLVIYLYTLHTARKINVFSFFLSFKEVLEDEAIIESFLLDIDKAFVRLWLNVVAITGNPKETLQMPAQTIGPSVVHDGYRSNTNTGLPQVSVLSPKVISLPINR